jgi:hypothetical protein
MCRKPRNKAKRKTWLKRYIVVLQKQLKQGFCETWLYPSSKRRRVKHWTAAQQDTKCRQALCGAQAELEALQSC